MARPLIEGHPAGVLQHEHHAALVASQSYRSGSPTGIQRFAKRIFVLEPFQAFRWGVLRAGESTKTRGASAVLRPRERINSLSLRSASKT
jgi:hypothetical protein